MLVLGNVKSAQHHNGFLAQIPARCWVGGVRRMRYCALIDTTISRAVAKARIIKRFTIHAENAAAPAEAVVRAAIVDITDAELAECGCAHDAWLHRHVESGSRKRTRRQGEGCQGRIGKYCVDSLELCMSTRLNHVTYSNPTPSTPRWSKSTHITKFVCAVPRAGDDAPVSHEDATDRDFS
jgi:hypothetical protein